MKKVSIALVGAVMAMLASVPSHATPNQTATYVTGGTISVTGVASGGGKGPQVEGVGRGGYTFPASTKPLRIKINDAVYGGMGIGFTACQVTDPNNPTAICGQTGTVTQIGCAGTAGTDLTGFVGGKELIVFIHAVNDACVGQATTGTITVSYA